MKLTDVISAMHCSIYATVPLLIFLSIFAGVIIHVLAEQKSEFEAMSRLPLDSERENRR